MGQNPERVIRAIRPSLIVLCGPAACGKSTFASRHFRPTQVVSSDHCRAMVCDDEQDQRYQPQAFALLHFLVGQRLSINRLCVIDSTALVPSARKTLLDLANKYGVRADLYLFNVPMEKCLERDRLRPRSVGQKVLQQHFALFDQAHAAVGSEGFTDIVELQDEDLESVRIEILYRPVLRPNGENGPKSHRRPPSTGSEPLS